jgi:hypothetical protein
MFATDTTFVESLSFMVNISINVLVSSNLNLTSFKPDGVFPQEETGGIGPGSLFGPFARATLSLLFFRKEIIAFPDKIRSDRDDDCYLEHYLLFPTRDPLPGSYHNCHLLLVSGTLFALILQSVPCNATYKYPSCYYLGSVSQPSTKESTSNYKRKGVISL